jgi:16S rRNA (guanine527-N7)-methyltransferase
MNPTIIKSDQELLGLLKDPKFSIYYENLISKNQVMNLTNITEKTEVYEKHFYDSIILSKVFDLKNKSLLDIGAGAGFPSLPLKIVEPNLSVTIIDSLNKRINFLQELTQKLAISDVLLIHGRAEEMDKTNLYDLVTARAVAKLNILSELALPFVKLNGFFVAYKSIKYEEELQEAISAITKLGGKLENIYVYNINSEIKHTLIVIKKVKTTPTIYPRNFGKIKKSSL